MSKKFMVVIEKDPESGMYIGIVPSIVGAHTMAETLEDLTLKIKEVLELCLEEMDEDDMKLLPEYEGSLQVGVTI
jgi:predicted RNase H-like HicB family nuclease